MAMFIPHYGEVLVCPYDKHHLILAERMQLHLIKCEKQHPNSNLRTCLFNITHRTPPEEYSEHLRNCPDRKIVDSYIYEVKSPTVLNASTASSSREEKHVHDMDAKRYNTASAVPAREETRDNQNNQTNAAEENWDDMNEPAYNPTLYCLQNPIIRKTRGLTKSEKRAFHETEQIRHAKLKERNG